MLFPEEHRLDRYIGYGVVFRKVLGMWGNSDRSALLRFIADKYGRVTNLTPGKLVPGTRRFPGFPICSLFLSY